MAIAAIAAGGLVAAVLPSNAAVSAQSVPAAAVRVESPAPLLARGAAVAVTVTVLCEPGGNGNVNVEVTENVGGRIAKGRGSINFVCTGTTQSLVVNASAEAPTPLRAGVAFGQAYLYVSTRTGSANANDDREFTITRSSPLV